MILYSRNDCPLCEDVEETLLKLNIKYTFVDIDGDRKLLQKYHVRIPVLVNSHMQELCWPFEEAELKEFAYDD